MKGYNRTRDARAILTSNEKAFLKKLKERHHLNSNQRHYLASILHKAQKGISDLELIFQKLDASDLAFIFSEQSDLTEAFDKLVRLLLVAERNRNV